MSFNPHVIAAFHKAAPGIAVAVSTALFSLPLPVPEVALVLLRNVVAMLCSVLLLAGVALFVGVLVLMYPSVAGWFSQYNQSLLILKLFLLSVKVERKKLL